MKRALFLMGTLAMLGAAGCGGDITATGSGAAASAGGGAGGGPYVAPPCDTDHVGAWSTALHVDARKVAPFAHLSGAAPLDDGVVVAAFVAGGTLDLAGEHLDPGNHPRFDLLARFDACGSPLWVQQIIPLGDPIVSARAGAFVAPPPATEEANLAAYDGRGDVIGTARLDACAFGIPTAGPGGLFLISGQYGEVGKAFFPMPHPDPAGVGGVSCSLATGSGAWLIALGPDGGFKWLRTFGGSWKLGVAADATGILVTGTFKGDLDLGGEVLHDTQPDSFAAEPFTARLDADGVSVWATANVGGSLVAPRSDGGVVVAGSGVDEQHVTLSAIDAAGEPTWSYGAVGNSSPAFLVVMPDDRVVVGVRAENGNDLAGANAPERALIFATFADGALLDQRFFPIEGDPSFTAGVAASGAVIVTGDNGPASGSIDFGQGKIATEDGDAVFLARIPLDPK